MTHARRMTILVDDRAEAVTGERPRVVTIAEHGVQMVQLKDPDGNRIQLSSSLAD